MEDYVINLLRSLFSSLPLILVTIVVMFIVRRSSLDKVYKDRVKIIGWIVLLMVLATNMMYAPITYKVDQRNSHSLERSERLMEQRHESLKSETIEVIPYTRETQEERAERTKEMLDWRTD